jgi:uncharacterized protein YndB with AHSA1/START domain
VAQPFEIIDQIEVPASPEQAWEAISTGPGMDAWFMGTSEVEPGEGGKVKMTGPGFTAESTITSWDPPNHFRYESPVGEDGTQHAFEYTIEARDRGTAIRWHHSGFLGGDWEAEYEAMQAGDPAYFFKLGQYLTYFFGRKATPVEAFGPKVEDSEQAFKLMRSGLGLGGPVAVGEKVRLTPQGFEPMEGEVDWVSKDFLGVRTDHAMLRFIHAFYGPLMIGHHVFTEGVDRKEAEEAWTSWLNGLVA